MALQRKQNNQPEATSPMTVMATPTNKLNEDVIMLGAWAGTANLQWVFKLKKKTILNLKGKKNRAILKKSNSKPEFVMGTCI
jgi:hypothetical protein